MIEKNSLAFYRRGQRLMEKDIKEYEEAVKNCPNHILEFINKNAERTAKDLLAIYYKELGDKDGEV